MEQINLHKKIIEFLAQDPEKSKPDDAHALISVNDDSRAYFFANAKNNWLTWLYDNGFLDVIKVGVEDRQIPELNYLVRMAEKVPEKVVEIILDVEIFSDTFNPEVVDRFLRICSTLSADLLIKLVPKILEEQWVIIMSKFNDWGFEYEKMLKILSDAKKYNELILLAEAVLSVKNKEDIENEKNYSRNTPFYFQNLAYTKVFEYLTNIDIGYQEKALGLAAKLMSKIVMFSEDAGPRGIFSVAESYRFADVDFFDISIKQDRHYSSYGDVQDLAAVIKILSKNLINQKCNEASEVNRIYESYIKTLPDSQSMWRLRLAILSLCPEIFGGILKDNFSLLFEKFEHYNIILSGAEYLKALKTNFNILSSDEKKKYIDNVFGYFGATTDDPKTQKRNYIYGSEVLSSIPDLPVKFQNKCKEVFGSEYNPGYNPEPAIGPIVGGLVKPRGPITPEEFNNIPVNQIIQNLKNEWTPKILFDLYYKIDDITSPRNAEGIGNLLKNDVAKRINDYLDCAILFLDVDNLSQHYTYSFLRGIQDFIKNNEEAAKEINWRDLIVLLEAIKDVGCNGLFVDDKKFTEKFDSLLSGWDGVHDAMTDVVQLLIGEGEENYVIDFDEYKDKLFYIISYLLSYQDPIPADEVLETATMKMSEGGSREYFVSDPYSRAINTVRGRAFQALLLFVYREGKGISDDCKSLYERVLDRENTRALMFMFGRFLPSFYFRDKEWIKEILPKIFTTDPKSTHLYLAAWEGYLSNALYEEIFFLDEFQQLYKRGLNVKAIKESDRKYFKDPEESIAIHLALAFMNYENFGFRHPLFQVFWATDNIESKEEFVNFFGSMFISGKNDRADQLLKDKPLAKKRLEKMWDFVLENCDDSKIFQRFGFWMNLEKNIFDISWLAKHVAETLKKSDGLVDWDYGLAKTVIKLADQAPKQTIKIAEYYLLGGVRQHKLRGYMHIDHEWFEALKILYSNPETKDETCKLVDDLIRDGGSTFWKFEEIVKD